MFWNGLCIPRVRTTTAEWMSVFPWHFGDAVPSAGPAVGLNLLTGGGAFGFDPFRLVELGVCQNPNVAIAGAPGNGKSAFAKQVIWNLVGAFGYRFVAVDVKGEYRALAQALGVPVLDLHPGGESRVNPLDDPDGRLEFVRALASLCVDRALGALESAALASVVRALPDAATTPDLLGILKDMPAVVCNELSMDRGDALAGTQDVRFGLGELLHGSLGGMFDGQSNVDLGTSKRGFVVDVSGCGSDERLLRLALLTGQRAMDQLVASSPGRTLVINDECWLLAGTAETVRWLQHSFKLGRNVGQANIIIVHRFSELGNQADGAVGQIASKLVADADIHVLFRQGERSDAKNTITELQLPGSTERVLLDLPAHRALIHVRSRLAMLDVMLSPRMTELAYTNTAMQAA